MPRCGEAPIVGNFNYMLHTSRLLAVSVPTLVPWSRGANP